MNDTPIKLPKYKHWRLASDIDKVLWLTIDRKGERVNSLSQAVLSELESIGKQLHLPGWFCNPASQAPLLSVQMYGSLIVMMMLK